MAIRGNRILIGVALGWVAWLFAKQLGMPALGSFVVLAVVATVTYALVTAHFASREVEEEYEAEEEYEPDLEEESEPHYPGTVSSR